MEHQKRERRKPGIKSTYFCNLCGSKANLLDVDASHFHKVVVLACRNPECGAELHVRVVGRAREHDIRATP